MNNFFEINSQLYHSNENLIVFFQWSILNMLYIFSKIKS